MITIKTPQEIEIMKESAGILSRIMKEVSEKVEIGITTNELNRLFESLVLKYKAKPNFKGYGGFPAGICASVNEEVVHAAPSERVLKQGDIITLDGGVLWKGYHSDMAITLPVGEISLENKKLISVTKKALKRGIKKARPGNTFGDIGNTIQRYVEGQGFNIVKELCGHGIGKALHEDPEILNYGRRKTGPTIKEGMVFCIEPMVTKGDSRLKKSKDGFGYITRDNSFAAHFEHTMVATKNGAQVITN
ncbi:MAG: type I methionyl aminopeptidase [Patescibacteria group bacterium]|nr:type I methionyl aminopeptidase [Patescibacteria group bacterium]